MEEEAAGRIPLQEIYYTTGIQFMFFNTLFQLLSEVVTERAQLQQADSLLFTPDLINYWLCGVKTNEYTIASTSQLLDVHNRNWAEDMLNKLSIPTAPLGNITMPATTLGKVLPQISEETGLGDINIIAVGSHDTASAVAAVPTETASYAYLSSGTWSLMGIEVDKPVVTEQSFEYGFTNEGGINGTIRLLKNITGLWLVQECRRAWSEAGDKLSFAELEKEARNAEPFVSFIDPDDAAFAEPCDMPARIQQYCEHTGQPIPQTKGAIIRTAMDSLAYRYKTVFSMLEDMAGGSLDTLHIVGGGTKDRLLSQLTANALNRRIIAGPVEATATGNVLAQMIAAGEISSIAEGRSIVPNSFKLETFEPTDTEDYAKAYTRFHDITGA